MFLIGTHCDAAMNGTVMFLIEGLLSCNAPNRGAL